ncbi:hypothetical protein KFK09_004357 [Dendrobium nobile]|uniref:Uncharacterized protein n=1 Tax=Dendrobium nobile TaxID=94219 RepID=A0A8T3C5I6_DENNO|nr:hypothetical protein KFK09_004357 [Dendrobium nobile]
MRRERLYPINQWDAAHAMVMLSVTHAKRHDSTQQTLDEGRRRAAQTLDEGITGRRCGHLV